MRNALLRLAANAPLADLSAVADVFAAAFRDAPIHGAKLRDTTDLVSFMLDSAERIKGPVLVIFDGADAIRDKNLRAWVIRDLAVRLGTDRSLHETFPELSVIVAGRFIHRDIEDGMLRTQHFEMFDDLEPFSGKSDFVADLVQRFNDPIFNRDPDRVRQLGRKLTQVSAGTRPS